MEPCVCVGPVLSSQHLVVLPITLELLCYYILLIRKWSPEEAKSLLEVNKLLNGRGGIRTQAVKLQRLRSSQSRDSASR